MLDTDLQVFKELEKSYNEIKQYLDNNIDCVDYSILYSLFNKSEKIYKYNNIKKNSNSHFMYLNTRKLVYDTYTHEIN